MKNRTFIILLSFAVALCALLTVVHLHYIFYAYQHCSIIYFIGRELW